MSCVVDCSTSRSGESVWLACAADELGCQVDCTGRRRARRAGLEARG